MNRIINNNKKEKITQYYTNLNCASLFIYNLRIKTKIVKTTKDNQWVTKKVQ
jgi:hypothetical protein